MLKTVAPYRIKGVLWNQGESDDVNYKIYEKLLTVLIKNWHEEFKNPKLPFFIVQLPSYNYVKSSDNFYGDI